MRKTFFRTAAASTATVLAFGLSACGPEKDNNSNNSNELPSNATPAQKLDASINALDDGSALGVTFNLDVSGGLKSKITGEIPNPSAGAALDEFLGGNINMVLATRDGEPLETIDWADENAPVDSAITVSTASGELASFLASKDTLYMHIATDELERLAGEKIPFEQLAQQDPKSADVVNAVADGKWLSVDLATLKKYTDKYEKDASLEQEKYTQMAKAVLAAIKDSAEVTEASEGTLEVKVNVQKAALSVLDAVRPQLTDQQASMLPSEAEVKKEIPADHVVTAVVTTNADGEAEMVSMDLVQILPPKERTKAKLTGEYIKLNFTFDTDATIVETPSDAVSADTFLSDVLNRLQNPTTGLPGESVNIG